VTNEIDDKRWLEVWSADLTVLENLADQGDKAHVARLVDVSFRGSPQSINSLEAAGSNFGFTVQSREIDEEGIDWLFLERVQPVDIETMRDFTLTYLQIEDTFGVECDGWGCIAHNENGPISNENPA
jgi:regulator of ribonuclease activity B